MAIIWPVLPRSLVVQTSVTLMAEREKERRQAGRLHSLGHSEVKEGHKDPFQQQVWLLAQYRPITFGRRHCEQSLHSTGGRQLQCLPEVGVGSNPPWHVCYFILCSFSFPLPSIHTRISGSSRRPQMLPSKTHLLNFSGKMLIAVMNIP